MGKRLDTEIEQVLPAAMALVAENGLKALTLRPLAERMQTTVSALSYRFGRKEDLLTILIATARDEDHLFLDTWLHRIKALAGVTPSLLAELADTILDDMARQHRLRTLFYCELLQASASRPEIAAALASWQALRLTFWQSLAQSAQRPDLGPILHAYAADEAVHGLVLGDNAAYRWLRRLGLQRICMDLLPEDNASGELFDIFHAALGDMLASGSGRYQVAEMSDWQASVAGHISALIVAEGADAITHRAVAERADVPSSTLAYHFPRQEDLLKAGLEDIISRLQGHVDALPAHAQSSSQLTDSTRTGHEIARATFAVALAATRMDNLKGFAADMRRRRGENLHAQLNRLKDSNLRFDRLAAQALSITGIGQVILGDGGDTAGADMIGQMISAAAHNKTS